MRIRPFEYLSADSLPQALQVLDGYAPEISVLAGGTDLVLALKGKRIAPKRILNITDIQELSSIRQENSTIRIGALTKHASVASHPLLMERVPALSTATGLVGSWQLRNVGTIGGNLCNASPSADSAPPLLALDASVVVANSSGEREIRLQDFFVGPRATVLKPTEILTEIVITLPRAPAFGVYLKLMRKKAVDLALVGVCVQAEVDEARSKLTRVAIALGGVAPTPIRAPEAEKILLGLSHQDAVRALEHAAHAAAETTRPISDVRASAEYRRHITEAFVARAGALVLDHLFSGVREA